MYRGNKDKLAMNHWYEWVFNGQDELFEKIYVLVEDMIKEIVPQITPQIIKEYYESNPTKFSVNPVIENNIRADLERAISKALK